MPKNVHVNLLSKKGYHGTRSRQRVNRIFPEASLFFNVFPVILQSKGDLEAKLGFKPEEARCVDVFTEYGRRICDILSTMSFTDLLPF